MKQPGTFLGFRDPISGGTHLLGALLGAIGAGYLVYRSIQAGSPRHIVAFAVFGVSLVLLYLASAAYHLLDVPEKARQVFRRLDHSLIFVFIAGSYTPYCLLALSGSTGAYLLLVVWLIALAGLLTKLFWMDAPRGLSTGIYLAMGWVALTVLLPLSRSLSLSALLWLVAGGLAYSIGAVIYALKRPDPFPSLFGFHEIWHLHVLAGSACHFLSIVSLLPHHP